MDQHQHEQRQTAAKAFIDSLEQLGMSLHLDDKQAEASTSASPSLNRPAPSQEVDCSPIDVELLEAAAADIEQFIQAKEQYNEPQP
jgi:hypothetical protein